MRVQLIFGTEVDQGCMVISRLWCDKFTTIQTLNGRGETLLKEKVGSSKNIALQQIVQLTRRNAQLITSVRLTETVLHGPSRLTAVPGLKPARAIISAWTRVPVPGIVRMGYRLVCRAA